MVLAGLDGGAIALKLKPGFSTKEFFELMLAGAMEGFFADPALWRQQEHGGLEDDRLSRRALRLPRPYRQA